MEKEFNVNEKLHLPEKIISKNVYGFEIILAPEYPNRLVLNSDEMKMFSDLRKNFTILQAMENFIEQKNISEDEVIKIMTGLLEKIDAANFYQDAETFVEEKIENFPKLIHINLTNNCNLRCRHCYMSAGKYQEQVVDFDKLKKFFENLEPLQEKSEIILSGGEPLTYKNFFEVLNFLDNGKNKITLFTNGTLIDDKNYKIIAEHCREVELSFEGITQNYFEKIRGKGNYHKVVNALNLLKSCGVRIIFAITLLPMTVEDVKNNLIEFIKSLDYKNFEVRLNSEIEFTGNAADFDQKDFDKKYLANIVIQLIRKLSELGVEMNFSNQNNIKFSNCGIGANLVIHYDEKIYPCHKFSDYKFKMSDNIEKIFQAFNKLNKSTSICNIKKCCACDLKYICGGGCRIESYIKNKNFLSPICDEKFKEDIYRKVLFDNLQFINF